MIAVAQRQPIPAMAPLLRILRNVDPTRTLTIRRAYEREVTKRWRDVAKIVREAIIDQDVFGLRGFLVTLQKVIAPGPKAFAFPTDARKVAEFDKWFKNLVDQNMQELDDIIKAGGIANIPDRYWQAQFVKQGYTKGAAKALVRMTTLFGDLGPMAVVQNIINSPFHRSRLTSLYTRNFHELNGITRAVAQVLRRELTEGLSQGAGVRTLAKRLNDKIKTIGINRARVMARTEIIRANASATLQVFRQFGVQQVTVQAEFVTAGDARVCPRCEELEGRIFSVDKAEGIIPVHVSCRCDWVPFIPGRVT